MLRPISQLKGVGAKTEKILHDMGIFTYYDMVTFYPKAYDCFKGLVGLSQLRMGEDNYLQVKITTQPKLQYYGKMSSLSFYVQDQQGLRARVTYFRQPYLVKTMLVGRVLVLKARPYIKKGEVHFSNPVVVEADEINQLRTRPLVARYVLKKGISEKKIRYYLEQILGQIDDLSPTADYLSQEIREEYGLLSWHQSLKLVHFPQKQEDMERARRRLVFDEFFFFQAGFPKGDHRVGNDFPLKKAHLAQDFINALPFDLTYDQRRTINQIKQDLQGPYRMTRLVQGDVGSGKTAVAFVAGLMVVDSGYQVALMAPTEVLAQQHYLEAQKKLAPLGIRCALLLGSSSAKEKKDLYQAIGQGEIDFIIGTHSLIQEKVTYPKLGLVITDEQHRFGVMQRERLSQKGNHQGRAHILVMSATPIPRTLALILYQDMDISVIKTMPAQRLPVQSFLRTSAARPRIYRFMEEEIKKGAGAYIICPAIEDNEELDLTGVITYTQDLQKAYPHLRMAYLHGGQDNKDQVMADFAEGHLDILVSTTVVEVGVNVPRASVMVIENAERFGLAQLHQLRGRVGRGNRQSYCIFLSDAKSETIREKLDYVASHTSGFDIAEYDLKMRGPGDAFGVKQHGLPMLQLADFYQDLPILDLVQKVSQDLRPSPALDQRLEIYYRGKKQVFSI